VLLATLAAAGVCIGTSSMFAADTEKVLVSFTGPDGANPQAGLIFDAKGNLYGTTLAGGSHNLRQLSWLRNRLPIVA